MGRHHLWNKDGDPCCTLGHALEAVGCTREKFLTTFNGGFDSLKLAYTTAFEMVNTHGAFVAVSRASHHSDSTGDFAGAAEILVSGLKEYGLPESI